MKVWFTEIGEPLPVEKSVRLHRYGLLTKMLCSYGHDITWWTSGFSHAEKKHVFNRNCIEQVDGVRLRVFSGLGYQKNISLRRVLHQEHFARKLIAALGREKCMPDLIVTPVPTLEVADRVVRFATDNDVPVLVDIRDEWPQEFVNLAPRRARTFARILLSPYFSKLKRICENASGIMAVSESFLDYGLGFAARSRSRFDGVFPLGFSKYRNDSDSLEDARVWWRQNGLREDSMICVFIGTMGKQANLLPVIDACRRLPPNYRIQFVFCGDGNRLSVFKNHARGCSNIIFSGWIDQAKIFALLDLAHIGLASYSDETLVELPNKVFDYLAGRVAVVSSLRGQFDNLMQQRNFGRYYAPNDDIDLAKILSEMYDDRDETERMAARARQVFESEFTVESIAERMNQHFWQLVDTGNHQELYS